jgi:hypothetical protein
MRTDLFEDRKCVHVKLNKELHFALRSKLFKHNISMQDLFDECARIIVSESIRGQSIINAIVNRKLEEQISGVKAKDKRNTMGELDSETLYNMINSTEEKENT